MVIYAYPSYLSGFLSHKYWPDLGRVKPRSMRKSSKKSWNELDSYFKPFNKLFITTIAPNIAPNSWPHVDQILSVYCDVKKAFPMSPAISPGTLFTAINNINLTDISLVVDY